MGKPKHKCQLIYENTSCSGAVLTRNLYKNAHIDCCVRHYQIFALLMELKGKGLDTKDLVGKTPAQLMQLLELLSD